MSIIYDEIKQGKRVDMQLFNAAVDDLHAQGAIWRCLAARN